MRVCKMQSKLIDCLKEELACDFVIHDQVYNTTQSEAVKQITAARLTLITKYAKMIETIEEEEKRQSEQEKQE